MVLSIVLMKIVKHVVFIEIKVKKNEIIIPSSIKYKEHEYYVTSILEDAFCFCLDLKSLKFAADSKLKKIGQNAFFNSSIESISFPPSLIELEEGWCDNTSKLIEINIDPNNHNFLFYDNKFLIGKSNQENENFDQLLFSRRDIENSIIPNFIRVIGPYAFNKCERLKHFEFPNDSRLEIIDKYSFAFSTINSIKIPLTVT